MTNGEQLLAHFFGIFRSVENFKKYYDFSEQVPLSPRSPRRENNIDENENNSKIASHHNIIETINVIDDIKNHKSTPSSSSSNSSSPCVKVEYVQSPKLEKRICCPLLICNKNNAPIQFSYDEKYSYFVFFKRVHYVTYWIVLHFVTIFAFFFI